MDRVLDVPQYSLGKILLVWAAASVPMGILGWVVAPLFVRDAQGPGLERLAVLTAGLIWQFVLVMILLYRETGDLRWSTIRSRLWLVTPSAQPDGEPRRRLWWWVVPILIATALFDVVLRGILNEQWVALFPLFSEPPAGDFGRFIGTPEGQAQVVGNWGLVALFVVCALFNTVIGEELLFRGLLLPRMAAVCGKRDWVMNGLLFGMYHLHQPWGMLSSAIKGMVLFALPSRYFRSAWFGIIAHSGQSVFFILLLLGLVMG